MKKGLMLGLLALFVFGLAGVTYAGLPCAAYCSTVMAFQRVSGTGLPCVTCDAVWSPAGTYEKVWIRVTVRDCLSAPVPTCDVRLDLSGEFDPNNDAGNPLQRNGRICGTASRTLTTDANGVVAFDIYGGGAGKYALHWTVTELKSDPDQMLSDNYDTLCIKSLDFNGTGNVNFQDTFIFAPQLNAGIGYTSDFRNCGPGNTVNFQDTFIYAPRLNAGDTCPGGAAVSFLLVRNTAMGDDCDIMF
ncbi:MAG: hypothetical protein ABIH26_14090 [Candidatus Eisenbacteria bacterium]